MAKRRIYAEDTTVAVGKSKQQIEELVTKHGADAFGTFADGAEINCFFRLNGRNIRFKMSDGTTPQKQRARWRALLLTIKAKLTSIEAGIETFDDAFLAQVVMANGTTVGEHAAPVLEQHYSGEHHIPLLPSPGD